MITTYIKLTTEQKKKNKQERRIEKWNKVHKIENDIIYKWCNSGQHWVEENDDNFYKSRCNSIDGYYPDCKPCSIRDGIQWVKDNREKHNKYKRQVYKENRFNAREIIKKSNQRRKELGKEKEWQQQNPDKVRYYSSLHRNHDVNTNEYNAMLKVFNYECAYCGMSLQEHKKKYNEKLHNDHIDEDGYNDLRNDVPACKGCNCSKHESTLEEWYPKQDFFSEERLNKVIWWTTEGYKDYIEDKPPYRISKSRVYNNDNTYVYQHELWAVDDKRNMIDCIFIGDKKKDVTEYIKENYKNK